MSFERIDSAREGEGVLTQTGISRARLVSDVFEGWLGLMGAGEARAGAERERAARPKRRFLRSMALKGAGRRGSWERGSEGERGSLRDSADG